MPFRMELVNRPRLIALECPPILVTGSVSAVRVHHKAIEVRVEVDNFVERAGHDGIVLWRYLLHGCEYAAIGARQRKPTVRKLLAPT